MFWKRLRKNEASEADAEQAAIAAEAGAQRRLDRLKQRRIEAANEASNDEARDAETLRGHFAECAFVVLGVPTDADQSAIAQAADDLSFAEEADPDAVEASRAALLAPKERVAHELEWLPEASGGEQEEARRALGKGDGEALFALRLGASGLARINLGLALLPVRAKDEDLQRTLMADLISWDAHATRDRIDEARLRAGFSPTSDEHFSEAVQTRRRTIATTVAEILGNNREGRVLIAEQIAQNGADIRACNTPMLEAVAQEYGRLADPKLQNLRGKIDEALASLENNPRDPARVTLIITTLDLWSQWRMPLQKLEEARGLDDPQSAELFQKLRELGITLSNEHKLFDESLRLAKALKHCFAAVPGLQQAVARDLPTLMGNVLFKRFEELTEAIARNLRDFAREIDGGGIGSDVGGVVGNFCSVFDELLEIDPHQEGPWIYFRELSVAIANKVGRADVSLTVVEWLLERNSPEKIRNQLVQDMCQLQRIIKEARSR